MIVFNYVIYFMRFILEYFLKKCKQINKVVYLVNENPLQNLPVAHL